MRDKWIAALRSGDYKQTIGTLRDATGSHCCLGVLCELYSNNGKGHWVEYERYSYKSDISGGVCPSAMSKEQGIESILPHLITLNDRKTPFTAIADLLERHWAGEEIDWEKQKDARLEQR